MRSKLNEIEIGSNEASRRGINDDRRNWTHRLYALGPAGRLTNDLRNVVPGDAANHDVTGRNGDTDIELPVKGRGHPDSGRLTGHRQCRMYGPERIILVRPWPSKPADCPIAQFRRQYTTKALNDRSALCEKRLQNVVKFLGVDQGGEACRLHNIAK